MRHLMRPTFMLFVLAWLASTSVFAANPSLVYQGRILKPNGDPLTASTVHFRIQIRTPGNENCLLYQETQDLDLSNTSGVFSLTINGSSSTRTDTSGYSFQNIFSNRAAFSFAGGSCSSGTTYSPASTDGRKLVISFDDGSTGGWESFPTQTLAYSAMSIESLQVGGYPASSLLRVANGSGPQTATAFTPADFTELTALIAGTSTQYLKSTDNSAGFTGSLSGDVTGTQGSTVVSKIRGVAVSSTAPTNGQALVYNGTSWAPGTVSSSSGTLTAVTSANAYISVANGTTAPDLTLNVGTTANTVAAGNDSRIVNALQPNTTIGGSTAINTSGNLVTSGTVSGATISGTSIRAYNSSNYVQLSAPSLSGNVSFTLPSADGTSGQVLKTNGSGALSWVSLPSVVDWSVSGSELIDSSRLNLGVGNANKVVTTSGTGAVVASTVTTTELGYLSGVTSAVQTQINNKQDTLAKTTTAPLSKVQIYGSNASNYVELTAPSLSSNVSFSLPSADGTSGQVLKTDGSGALSWVSAGTVTSVSSANSYLSVANGTSTPALTLNVGTSANTVAAGDDSRIVNALQPNTTIGGSTAINTSGNLVTSGTVSGATVSATNLRAYNSSNYVQLSAPTLSGNVLFTLPSADGTSGQVLKTDGSGAWSWTTIPVTSVNSQTGAVSLTTDNVSEGSTNLYYTNARTIASTLTGLDTTLTGSISSTDSILTALGRVQYQINNKQATLSKTTTAPLSKVQIYGSNASNYVELTAPSLSSNVSFSLPSADGTSGQVLKTDGSGNLSWTSVSGAVSSVNSQTGAVSLTSDNITEGSTNLYSTSSRILATTLTGYSSSTNTTLATSDSILSAMGKIQAQITARAALAGATFTGNVSAPAFLYTSDRRFKRNIATIDSALDKTLQLRGVTFNWKKDGKPEIGFIAQEVEKIMPVLVLTQNPGTKEEYKSVKYGNIIAVVVEAIKEFYAEFTEHKQQTDARIVELEQKNAELEQKYLELQQQIQELKNQKNSQR